jgi:hypothetical protein
MRYCKFRNKKGGSKNIVFPKPKQSHASPEDVLGDMTKQQDIRNKMSGGSKDKVVIPTMAQGGDESTSATKTAIGGLLQAEADSEFDTPPTLKGGRRKTKRKKRKRPSEVCVKKCTRRCYTPKRGGKRHKTRRKKKRKKSTRRHGGVKSPLRKKPPIKKTPISPPRKKTPIIEYIPSGALPTVIETVATYETTNPKKLIMKSRGPPRKVPTTNEAKQKALTRRLQEKMRTAQKVFERPRGGMRKTRKRKRKNNKKKTRK